MSFSKHLFDALARQQVELREDGNIRLDVMPPFYCKKKEHEFHVLFTMWEFDSFPDTKKWGRFLEWPDLIVVPCAHNQELFRRYTDRPVEVCHLGIDENYYRFHDRNINNPFIFLFVGDKNVRKGIAHIKAAWWQWNKTHEKESQLIVKITEEDGPRELKQVAENVFEDSRVLPYYPNGDDLPTLRQLYYSADAFLFPTMGEGFGLTLAEAMATGLPCVYTPWSGPVDFCSEAEGYPVDYDFMPFEIMYVKNKNRGRAQREGTTHYASPVIDSVVERMEEIFYNYDEALKKGKAASEKIHTYFTWDKTAIRLIKLIEKHARLN